MTSSQILRKLKMSNKQQRRDGAADGRAALSGLADDALTHLLMQTAPTSLHALSVTCSRLRDTIAADSFWTARFRAGLMAVEAVPDLRTQQETDAHAAANVFWQRDEYGDDDPFDDEDGDPLDGWKGESDQGVRHFSGAIVVDGHKAGKFWGVLANREMCHRQGGEFMITCDMVSQDLVNISMRLFDDLGLPRYAPLKADATCTSADDREQLLGEQDDESIEMGLDPCLGDFLYITRFELTPAFRGGPVPTAVLPDLAVLAVKALLQMDGLYARWTVAAYIGDGCLDTYKAAAESGLLDRGLPRGDEWRQRQVDDCRPFVEASFDEIAMRGKDDTMVGNYGWLFTTKSRLRTGVIRSDPLRAVAGPHPFCSAAPAGPDKELSEMVVSSVTNRRLPDEDVAGNAQLFDAVRASVASGANIDRSHVLHAVVASSHMWMSRNRPALLAGLLALGASVDARDVHGLTPLMLAAQSTAGHRPNYNHTSVDDLLSRGADTSLTDPGGCSALGCFWESFCDNIRYGGVHDPAVPDVSALVAKLTPQAGPTAADAAAAAAAVAPAAADAAAAAAAAAADHAAAAAAAGW
jgi:hypothetical protein